MKKSAIALAVATALGISVSAQAATTLYGSARASLNYVDLGGNTDAYMTFIDNGSRFGVRGNEDLGNGLKAIYEFTFGLNVATDEPSGNYWASDRPRFLGLEGGFGKIRAGTMETPEYDLFAIVDQFNFSRSYAAGMSGARVGFLARYDSPSFSGFQVQAATRFDGPTGEEYLDRWNLVAKYTTGPFLAGLSYFQNNGLGAASGTRDGKRWGAAIGYKASPLAIGFVWERGNFDGDNSRRVLTVSGNTANPNQPPSITTLTSNPYYGNFFHFDVAYTIGANTLRAYYGRRNFDDAEITLRNRRGAVVASAQQPEDVNYFNLGVQHNLSKRTRLWVEYGTQDEPDNQHLFSVGMRHDF